MDLSYATRLTHVTMKRAIVVDMVYATRLTCVTVKRVIVDDVYSLPGFDSRSLSVPFFLALVLSLYLIYYFN